MHAYALVEKLLVHLLTQRLTLLNVRVRVRVRVRVSIRFRVRVRVRVDLVDLRDSSYLASPCVYACTHVCLRARMYAYALVEQLHVHT